MDALTGLDKVNCIVILDRDTVVCRRWVTVSRRWGPIFTWTVNNLTDPL